MFFELVELAVPGIFLEMNCVFVETGFCLLRTGEMGNETMLCVVFIYIFVTPPVA